MILVTVIIPTYNRPELLNKAVSSVLDQNIEEIEILIIDDCSDISNEIAIRKIVETNERIRCIRNNKNLGVAESRNIGILNAQGDYLLFLDDDDQLLPEMIDQSLQVLSTQELDAVSCRSSVVSEIIVKRKVDRYNRQQKEEFELYPMDIHPMEHIFLFVPQIHTFLIRRSSIGETRFNKELKYGEDIFFWISLAAKGCRFQKSEFIGCMYHLHDDSSSLKIAFNEKIKFYRTIHSSFQSNKRILNIANIKRAYLFLKRSKKEFIMYFLRAISSPSLFFQHLKYYIKSL